MYEVIGCVQKSRFCIVLPVEEHQGSGIFEGITDSW